MKALPFFVLAVSFVPVLAQAPKIRSGSTVYLESTDGYETYLAAAFLKKHVPLTVVTNKENADYILTSTVSHLQSTKPSVEIKNSVTTNVDSTTANAETPAQFAQHAHEIAAERRALLGQTNASISINEVKSSRIVFAYAAGNSGSNQLQRTAEDCAKHIKEFIDKPEKGAK